MGGIKPAEKRIKVLEELNSVDEFEIDRCNSTIRRLRDTIQMRNETIERLCVELDESGEE